MQQLEIYGDITERRHGHNAESHAAHQAILPALTGIRHRVLMFAAARGQVTLKDVMESLDLSHPTASARLTELKAMRLLVPTDLKRAGCRVLGITEEGLRRCRQK